MAINLSDYSCTAAQRGWGAGWPSCGGARSHLVVVTADRSGTRVSVHARISRLVDMLLDETERRGYLMKKGQTGAYNCRAIGGTKSPSNHSWGLAVDVNWQENPYTTDLRDRTIPDWMPPLWNRYGFAWGGHYAGSKKDFMHWEFMGSPEDADAMTALALKELTGARVAPTVSEEDEMASVVLTLPAGMLQKQPIGVPPHQPGTARFFLSTGWESAHIRNGYFIRDRGPGLSPQQEGWGGTGPFTLVPDDRPSWPLPEGCTQVSLEYDSQLPLAVVITYKPA